MGDRPSKMKLWLLSSLALLALVASAKDLAGKSSVQSKNTPESAAQDLRRGSYKTVTSGSCSSSITSKSECEAAAKEQDSSNGQYYTTDPLDYKDYNYLPTNVRKGCFYSRRRD